MEWEHLERNIVLEYSFEFFSRRIEGEISGHSIDMECPDTSEAEGLDSLPQLGSSLFSSQSLYNVTPY